MSNERYTPTHLKAVLEKQGRTGAWLAKRTGLSSSLVEKALRGERTFNADAADLVADALDLPLFLLMDVAPVRESGSDATTEIEAVA